MKVTELKKELLDRKLPTSGIKPVLINRLLEDDQNIYPNKEVQTPVNKLFIPDGTSLSGIEDIDLEILSKLDDESLLRACDVNHYTKDLCNKKIWEQRLINLYGSAFGGDNSNYDSIYKILYKFIHNTLGRKLYWDNITINIDPSKISEDTVICILNFANKYADKKGKRLFISDYTILYLYDIGYYDALVHLVDLILEEEDNQLYWKDFPILRMYNEKNSNLIIDLMRKNISAARYEYDSPHNDDLKDFLYLIGRNGDIDMVDVVIQHMKYDSFISGKMRRTPHNYFLSDRNISDLNIIMEG